jgi:hypothetical protein
MSNITDEEIPDFYRYGSPGRVVRTRQVSRVLEKK